MSPNVKREWRTGHFAHIDANEAYRALQALRRKHGRLARPEEVVAEASDAGSVLHDAFQWDDTIAAHEHRKETARTLVRSIVEVRVEHGERHTRPAFVHVKIASEDDEEKEDRGYIALNDALRNKALRAQILERALRELEAWEARYRELSELAAVFEARERITSGN